MLDRLQKHTMEKVYSILTGLTLFSLTSLSTSSPVQHQSVTQLIPQTQQTTVSQSDCPLPANIAVTFLGSKCREVLLQEPRAYYRYYSSSTNKFGRYLTTDRYTSNVQIIRNLALKQEWGNQATMMLTVTVPAGTKVYEGIVAPQIPASCYPGGGQQTFIENSKDPNLKWSEGTPVQVEPFQCPQ